MIWILRLYMILEPPFSNFTADVWCLHCCMATRRKWCSDFYINICSSSICTLPRYIPCIHLFWLFYIIIVKKICQNEHLLWNPPCMPPFLENNFIVIKFSSSYMTYIYDRPFGAYSSTLNFWKMLTFTRKKIMNLSENSEN